MRTLCALRLVGLAGCMGVVACSGSKDDANSGTTPGYKTGSGTSGQFAQDTVDGQVAISASNATSLNANACVQGHETPKGSGQPILEFVIDASGSMASDPANPADPNSQTKWEVFSATMPSVFASLPATFAVGVSYFNAPRNGCYVPNQAVPIAVLDTTQQSKIKQSILDTHPTSYTPTYAAWQYGHDTVQAWPRPAGYETSPLYIVLITDGVPTVQEDGCTTQNPISQIEFTNEVTDIHKAYLADAIKTFVVGVVGSENPQGATYDPLYMLSLLAVACGTGEPAGCVPVSGTVANDTLTKRGTYCHFDLSQAADFATALTTSLGTIAQSVVSCDYAVPAAPAGQTIDPAQIVLEYIHGDGTYSLILQNTSATCDRGWQFTDATNSQIHICGVTCDAIQSNPAAELNLVFGCGVSQVVN